VADARAEPLLRSLRALGPIGEPAAKELRAIVTSRRFETGATLLRAGDDAELCHWVEHGLVREYYIDGEGAEHVRRFLAAGEMTGSLLDLLSGKPAVTFIEALEPTQTLAFCFARFDTLCDRFAELQLIARRVTERLYLCKAQREHEMLALSARARLQLWMSEQAGLDARVSRRHLASYLGITPEHLSRLRRGL